MTAQPHPDHQLLTRIIALENKVKTDFDVLRAKVEEYRLLCENKHLHTLVVSKEHRITQLEQELETSQKKNKDLEQKLQDLEERCEEMEVEMSTVNLVSNNNNVEPEVNITNRDATENIRTTLEQLLEFTRDGNIAEVKSIIESGVDVNVAVGGFSPLFIGARYGHTVVCEYLMDEGADVNIRDNGGRTPLHEASDEGHIDVVKFLIARGASVATTDLDKFTPLHYASVAGHTVICEYLLDKGADVNIKDIHGRTYPAYSWM